MTDLLQNVQEVYKKWESKSVPNRGRQNYSGYRNRYVGRRQNYGNDRSARGSKRTPVHNAVSNDFFHFSC